MGKKKEKVFNYAVTVEFDPEDRIHIARCPELEGCQTFGSTPQEAMSNIQEAIALHIEQLEAEGAPVPVPLSEQRFSGKFFLRMDPVDHRDMALAAKRSGLSLNKYVARAVKKQMRSA